MRFKSKIVDIKKVVPVDQATIQAGSRVRELVDGKPAGPFLHVMQWSPAEVLVQWIPVEEAP